MRKTLMHAVALSFIFVVAMGVSGFAYAKDSFTWTNHTTSPYWVKIIKSTCISNAGPDTFKVATTYQYLIKIDPICPGGEITIDWLLMHNLDDKHPTKAIVTYKSENPDSDKIIWRSRVDVHFDDDNKSIVDIDATCDGSNTPCLSQSVPSDAYGDQVTIKVMPPSAVSRLLFDLIKAEPKRVSRGRAAPIPY